MVYCGFQICRVFLNYKAVGEIEWKIVMLSLAMLDTLASWRTACYCDYYTQPSPLKPLKARESLQSKYRYLCHCTLKS